MASSFQKCLIKEMPTTNSEFMVIRLVAESSIFSLEKKFLFPFSEEK